jgi:hypothetical protein
MARPRGPLNSNQVSRVKAGAVNTKRQNVSQMCSYDVVGRSLLHTASLSTPLPPVARDAMRLARFVKIRVHSQHITRVQFPPSSVTLSICSGINVASIFILDTPNNAVGHDYLRKL